MDLQYTYCASWKPHIPYQIMQFLEEERSQVVVNKIELS